MQMTMLPVPAYPGGGVAGPFSFDEIFALSNEMVPGGPLSLADDLAFQAAGLPGTAVVPYGSSALHAQQLVPYVQRALPSGGPFVPGEAYPMGGGAPRPGAWAWGGGPAPLRVPATATIVDDLAAQAAGTGINPGLAGYGARAGTGINPGLAGYGRTVGAGGGPIAAGVGAADDVAAAAGRSGLLSRLFPNAPKWMAGGNVGTMGRIARFGGPMLLGQGVSMLGSGIKGDAEDVKGIDKNDVGSFIEGAGLGGGLGGGLALALGASGPVGWGIAGAGALGFGLYKALWGGEKDKGPDIDQAVGIFDQLIGQAPAHLQPYYRALYNTQWSLAGDDKQAQAQVLQGVSGALLNDIYTEAQSNAREGGAADLAAQIAANYRAYMENRQDDFQARDAALNQWSNELANQLDPDVQAIFRTAYNDMSRSAATIRELQAQQADFLPYQLAAQLVQSPTWDTYAQQQGMMDIAPQMDQSSQLAALLGGG
jgi:hypothetical protein